MRSDVPYHLCFGSFGTEDQRRATEFIDSRDHLHVPVANSLDPAPKREGWKPYFVNIVLTRPTQKVILYQRTN